MAGSSATYATLCDVFAKQGKWEKLRTAVQVKGGSAACGRAGQGWAGAAGSVPGFGGQWMHAGWARGASWVRFLAELGTA